MSQFLHTSLTLLLSITESIRNSNKLEPYTSMKCQHSKRAGTTSSFVIQSRRPAPSCGHCNRLWYTVKARTRNLFKCMRRWGGSSRQEHLGTKSNRDSSVPSRRLVSKAQNSIWADNWTGKFRIYYGWKFSFGGFCCAKYLLGKPKGKGLPSTAQDPIRSYLLRLESNASSHVYYHHNHRCINHTDMSNITFISQYYSSNRIVLPQQ